MNYKLGIFASHPIQYKVPLYQSLAESDDINVEVLYGSKRGVEESDLGFGESESWDIPLLEGYDHEFLTNLTPVNGDKFLSLINPAVFRRINPEWDAMFLHAGYFRLTSWMVLLSCTLKDIPVLLHGAGTVRERGTPRKLLKTAYIRTSLLGVNTVLADCSANEAYYRTFGGQSIDIELLPAAVDNERFQSARADIETTNLDEVRTELSIPEEHNVILFVGKLIERKRPTDLLTAFTMLPEDLDVTLVYVGDGEQRTALEDRVAKEGIGDVKFAGFRNQSELPIFYELADIFVLPSEYDPSPKVLNEAMNFELPVVVAEAVGSAADLVQDNGILFDTGNIKELSAALEQVLSASEERRRMGRRSLKIINEWSFDRDVKVIRDVLEEVA